MLARYPKVESAHVKGSDTTTTNVVCPPILRPRLCIDGQDKSGGDTTSDWGRSQDGGCDSAPVMAEGTRESDDRFFFVLGDHVHRHHHYPRCVRQPIAGQFRGQHEEGGRNLRNEVRTAISVSLDDDNAVMNVSPEEDFKRLRRCVHLLQCSGYYYEGLSWQQATLKLRKCRVGTFLVRDSENTNYLFTLSVQTKKGPTSVRIAYKGGRFRLDSDEDLVSRMPVFDTVTDLVEYYVKISSESPHTEKGGGVSCCWLDLAGECSAPVELYYPLYKQVHSLRHLSRMNVVKQLMKSRSSAESVGWTLEHSRSLCLPIALKEYIKEYPHGE